MMEEGTRDFSLLEKGDDVEIQSALRLQISLLIILETSDLSVDLFGCISLFSRLPFVNKEVIPGNLCC